MMKYYEPNWPEGMKLLSSDLNQVMWGLWGSAGRGELSKDSDVDILIWAPDQDAQFTPPAIAKWQTHRPVDLLRVETDPYERACKSGIDLYAIYSARALKGDPALVKRFKLVQKRLKDDEFLRAREALHIILGNSSFGTDNSANNPMNIKAMPGGMRAWAALGIAHAFLYPDALMDSSNEMWQTIAKITDHKANELLEARAWLSDVRNLRTVHPSHAEMRQLSDLWKDVASKYLDKHLEWIQHRVNADANLLEKAIRLCLESRMTVAPSDIKNDSVDSFLRAIISADSEELDAMAEPNSDWWTIAIVASNPYTQAETLDKLAFPLWDFDLPGWRLPRGRIVVHLNTASHTLEKLADTDSNMVGTFPHMAKRALVVRKDNSLLNRSVKPS